MVVCPRCGRSGSLAEFALVAQAEVGPVTLRRCPTCHHTFPVDELELGESEDGNDRPWGMSDIWGRKFSGKNEEV